MYSLSWSNHLDPELQKKPISPEEEKLLFENYSRFPNQWAKIAQALPGRTDNNVKNYFHATLRRKVRKIGRIIQEQEGSSEKTAQNYAEEIPPEIAAA